jgi:chromosome segregation and condensation protein ScpB
MKKKEERSEQIKRKPQAEPAAIPAEARPAEASPVEVKLDDIITIARDGGRPRFAVKSMSSPAEDKPAPKESVVEPPAQKEEVHGVPAPEAAAPARKISRKKAAYIQPKVPAVTGEVSAPKESKSRAKPRKAELGEEEGMEEPKPDLEPPADGEEMKSADSEGERKIAVAEAALFIANKPLMLDELAKIMGVSSLGYVKEALEKLQSSFEGRGIELANTSSGWKMQVRNKYLGSVAHLAPYADLSEGPKKALALILFKEPMKQSMLIKMQGNKVYNYLRVLEKMGMVRREPWGRTKILRLTKEFEAYFGEDKAKIKERLQQEIASMPKPVSAPEAEGEDSLSKQEAAKAQKFKDTAKKLNLDIAMEDTE